MTFAHSSGVMFEKFVTNANAGIIDQHIDAAHQANGLLKGILHPIIIRDIGDNGPSELRQILLNPFAGFLIAIKNADRRALFEKPGSRGRANTTGATSNEHTFALQASHGFL